MRSAEDLVNWLDRLFAALDLGDRIHLAGISYGGWIAGQYALARPQRLASLILLAPVFTVLPLSAGFIARAILCLIPHRRFTRSFIHWLAADAAAGDDESRARVEAMVDDGYLGSRSFKRRQPVRPTLLGDQELAGLAMPVLYLVGENERIYQAEAAVARLNRVAPAIRTEMIRGAGHDLTIAQTQRVNAAMLDFLAGSA